MRVALVLADDDDIRTARDVLRETMHREADLDESVDVAIVDVRLLEREDVMARIARLAADVITVGTEKTEEPLASVANLPALEPQLLRDALAELASTDRRVRKANDLLSAESLFAGHSPAIQKLVEQVARISQDDEPVSIFGEDGAGRWVVARALHDGGPRREQPFTAINAAAHTDDQLARLLFGDDGIFATAPSGTIFLDRLGLIAHTTQRRVFKVLQTDATRRVRMIAGLRTGTTSGVATPNVMPELFYRMKVFELEIPHLRERVRDLEAIVERMLARLGHEPTPVLGGDALRMLQRYSFPGNLLELAHVLIHAAVMAGGNPIRVEHLPASIRRSLDEASSSVETLGTLDEVVKRFERDYVVHVLRAVGGNRGRAAAILGMSRKGLWGKLKAHAIGNEEIELGAEADFGPRRP